MDIFQLVLLIIYIAYIPVSFIALLFSSLILSAMIRHRKDRAVFSVFFLKRSNIVNEIKFIMILLIAAILFDYLAYYGLISGEISPTLSTIITYLLLLIAFIGFTVVLFNWVRYTLRFVKH